MNCTVTTPEKTKLNVEATAIVVPLFDGEFGILPGHAPMIGRLGYGLMRVTDKSGVKTSYYVDGGFVQVADELVTILTDAMVDPQTLKSAQTSDELRDALALPSNKPELAAIKNKAVMRARARDHIASN